MKCGSLKKVHVGCGTVYLQGYINVDVRIPGISFLAKDRPDIVKHNITSVDRYYKFKVGRKEIETMKLANKFVVVDRFADALHLPFRKNSLDEIRAVQVFEHFTYKEGEKLLDHWHDLLKPAGLIHIDVPDLDETIKGYLKAQSVKDKCWYLRLLFGSQKNSYNLHKAMYSKNMLKILLRKYGFYRIRERANIHFYPAFAIEARKL